MVKKSLHQLVRSKDQAQATFFKSEKDPSTRVWHIRVTVSRALREHIAPWENFPAGSVLPREKHLASKFLKVFKPRRVSKDQPRKPAKALKNAGKLAREKLGKIRLTIPKDQVMLSGLR